MTGTVYVLVDPRGDTIRYVGQTKRPIAQRLGGHLSSRGVPVADWVSELRNLGLTGPELDLPGLTWLAALDGLAWDAPEMVEAVTWN